MKKTMLLCLLIVIAALVSALVAVTAAILVKRSGTRWELSLLGTQPAHWWRLLRWIAHGPTADVVAECGWIIE